MTLFLVWLAIVGFVIFMASAGLVALGIVLGALWCAERFWRWMTDPQ